MGMGFEHKVRLALLQVDQFRESAVNYSPIPKESHLSS